MLCATSDGLLSACPVPSLALQQDCDAGVSNTGHCQCVLLASIFQGNTCRCSPRLAVSLQCWVLGGQSSLPQKPNHCCAVLSLAINVLLGLSQCSREAPQCEDGLLPAFRSTSGAAGCSALSNPWRYGTRPVCALSPRAVCSDHISPWGAGTSIWSQCHLETSKNARGQRRAA